MPSGFLYRRLAPLIPCVLQGVDLGEGLALRNKYEVASARDVFLSANYWRIYDLLESPPKLIVDLGGHCGHFTILCHLLICERFGHDAARYVSVEPIARLVKSMRRTLRDVGMEQQVQVLHGLVGRRTGTAEVFAPRNSLLIAATDRPVESRGQRESAKYIDLGRVIGADEDIDILKIDIEGSEYEFLENYEDLIGRATILCVELHRDRDRQEFFLERVFALGFRNVSKPIERAGCEERLFVLKRDPGAG